MIKSYFLKLNARQLVIHFMAAYFFIFALRTLISLVDYAFLYTNIALKSSIYYQEREAKDVSYLTLGENIGLIIAYLLSWQVSKKYDWFWLNSVVVLVVAFALNYFNFLGWDYLKSYFLYPGHLVFAINSQASLITDVIVLSGIGSLLIFLKPIINFIDRGVKREVKAPQQRPSKASKTAKSAKSK
jgi:hypothetical protein